MKKIFILSIILLFKITATAQNCDSTRLFSEAIKRSIQYSDSIFNLLEYPSSSEGIIDTNIYIEFFREHSIYIPNKVGSYTIHKISEKKINKIFQEGYQKSIKDNNIENFSLYDIYVGLLHTERNKITVSISFHKKITETEYDTMNVRHEITHYYFMQESQYTYKFDCRKQKFILENEKHSRGHDLGLNTTWFRQENKSLIKSSLELFVAKLSQALNKTDTFNISSGYLLYEPKVDTAINNKINGVNIDFLFSEKEQHYYNNRIPFKFIDFIIWECNGQLVYTIYYKKHKKAFMQKNIVEKFLYTGNYYYQFNCETKKWELAKTEFQKPNKRVKWK